MLVNGNLNLKKDKEKKENLEVNMMMMIEKEGENFCEYTFNNCLRFNIFQYYHYIKN